jgi:urease accessory protein
MPNPAAEPRRQVPRVADNRAHGLIEAGFVRVGARTEILGPYETGGYRLRLPRSRGRFCEAVIVNTGGGMAGGDHAGFVFSASDGAAVTLTTTAAEKIYRGRHADGANGVSHIDVAIELARGATLDWVPQETILFDGARLDRRLSVEMAPDADLLVAEMLVFGRLAMGERVNSGSLRDRWRLRRGGRLVLAEDLALGGDVAGLLDRPALGDGGRASATVVLVSPHAEALIDQARAALAVHDVVGGVSAWNGMLVARSISLSPERLRAANVALLSGLRGCALPRLWT